MSVTLNGSSGLVFSDGTVQGTAAGMPFRNRIINGDMRIDQRNAGNSLTITTDPQYSLDRWKFGNISASKVSAQRSTVAPPGFANSILITSLAATSIATGDYYGFQQDIEGLNCTDLNFGISTAKSITISFWIRCSITGTFSVSIRNGLQNRSYLQTYTVTTANTWEYKTVTVPGDTTGTWSVDNGVGIRLTFALGVGSTFTAAAGTWHSSNRIKATGAQDFVSTNGATMYITGVQVEKATAPTDFEFRPFQTELAMCQRYCYVVNPVNPSSPFCVGTVWTSSTFYGILPFPVQMRSSPSANSFQNQANMQVYAGGGVTTSTSLQAGQLNSYCAEIVVLTAATMTPGWGAWIRGVGSSASPILSFSSEL